MTATNIEPDFRNWPPDGALSVVTCERPCVWLVELDAGLTTGDDVETAEPGTELALLSPDEQARGARFLRARDRRRFVSCRAALRQILGSLLGVSPDSLRFQAGGQGKPELVPGPSLSREHARSHPLRFNVSHTADLALIAVCEGREVGIDIERVRTMTEADRIISSFFSPAEEAEFAAIPRERKPEAFMRGWTRKEAVLKGLGVGLAGLAAHYETGFGTGPLTSRFTPADPAPRVDQWSLWEACPRAGFVAALAVREL